MSRVRVERSASWSAYVGSMFEDMHFVYAGLGGAAEGVLMQQRRTRGHHHPVELEFPYVLLDEFLARV